MTIGLDVDDTMTNSSESIIEYAKKYLGSDDMKLVNNILRASNIDAKLLDFYDNYLREMMSNYTLKSNVKEVIDRLRKAGHKVIIITARGFTVNEGLVELTQDYLKDHNIIVDKIIFRALDKSDACIENKVDIMIDDSIKTVEELNDLGIKTLLFTSITNKDVESRIDRVENWLELEDYINRLVLD